VQSQPLGRRIAIYGGGGKTSLADALARKLGIRHISLDAIQWRPNWAMTPEDEFTRTLEGRLDESTDGWVTDGNYSQHRPMILAKADTVIIIQLWFAALFWRILLRCV
jgi:adenylate kinase family enzyme